MVSAPTKNVCFFFGVLSHYLVMIAHCLPYWRVNDSQASSGLPGKVPRFDGIWWQCISFRTGEFLCNNYGKPPILSKTNIQATRALMLISTIFSFIGALLSLLSLDCVTFSEARTKSKRTLVLLAGISYLITALSCGAATSWFAFRIIHEYRSFLYQRSEITYLFGYCLYIGWVAALFDCIAGLTLTFGSCWNARKKYNDDYLTNRSNQDHLTRPSMSSPIAAHGTKSEYV